ncbi:alpha/beta-hydrolase [Piedraia hortae CBS 480.64]|uniref:Alpha/beta-hydrolase n=1 Tax=Piedraia hortae CBS 480.64 TaxID=1314780 RepID=A0A6A7C971_9PEZI|nr:alpha/beta-hydrolase [Piedraia hortae CBS 480.64]
MSFESDKSSPAAQLAENYAQLFVYGKRSPILRRPSDKTIIANHPATCNRSGYPGQLDGFGAFGGFEVNFIPDYKALHNAGYNIICYDIRNNGISDAGCGGINGGLGHYECRDVVGSLIYARNRKELKGNSIGFLSRCLGGNSTMHAMQKYPEYFKGDDIKAVILLQAVSGRTFVERGAENQGINVDEACKAFDKRLFELSGFHIDDLDVRPLAKYVTHPTLVAQVRKDFLIHSQDTQDIYDNLGAKEKELVWIEDTDRRFDGYNYFAKEPKKMVGWFDKYM